MKSFCMKNRCFSRMIKYLMVVLSMLVCAVFSACKKEVRYFDYVSEVRRNIFLAEGDGFSLRAYAVEKEYPYETDGIKRDTSTRAEVYLVAPSGDKTCTISFTVGQTAYGGEMSFDNVKAEYYYSCSLDISALKEIVFAVEFGEETKEFTALSVRTETTLSAEHALDALVNAEGELFQEMTDKYGFTGEIYLRLIFEEKPYYYVGVTDRSGNTTAFLMNAETGKVLAKRQP